MLQQIYYYTYVIFSILKAGVACVEDAKKLCKDHGVIVQGCIDLRNLAIRSRTVKFG